MNSTVSVIIPSFNAELSIGKSLEALRKQTVNPLEIIVVDGGSRDKTRDIARKLGARVFVEKKKGPVAARNLGSAKAKGTILLFTDADCIPESGWVEKMEREVRKRSIVGGSIEPCSTNIFSIADDISMFGYNNPTMPSRPLQLLVTANLGVKKQIFMEVNGFDENLITSEDTDLCMRINKRGYKSYFLSEAKVKHRHGRCGLSSLVKRHYKAGKMGGGMNRARYNDAHSSYSFFPKNPYMLLIFSPLFAVVSSIECTIRSAKWNPFNIFLMPLVTIGKFFWLMGAFNGMRGVR